MEFDKSRVYTALNADELKIGSEIVASDYLSNLKDYVEREKPIQILKDILCEEKLCRFDTDGGEFALAYLVSEPEEKKLKWTDLKVGDIIRSKISGVKYLITGFDERQDKERHIRFADKWVSDNDLGRNWEKVE